MLEQNEQVEAEGKFDKRRYIAVVGREALHVFDLHKRDFIEQSREQGYITN